MKGSSQQLITSINAADALTMDEVHLFGACALCSCPPPSASLHGSERAQGGRAGGTAEESSLRPSLSLPV